MFLRIAQKEMLSAFRDRRVRILGTILWMLLLVETLGGYINYQLQQEEVQRAQAEKRRQWLNQDPKHPHIAAHFGTFAFKPKSVLSLMDYGLDAYAGTSVYLEAHRQHDFLFRPAQDYPSMIRFGELSIALVLQLLMPLLIIFLCFTSFTQEREDGTLRLLLSQGVTMRQLAFGKIAGYCALLALLVLPLLFVAGASLALGSDVTLTNDIVWRMLGLLLGYALYFFVFVALAVTVSLLSNSSRTALLVLLGVWILSTIIIPKTAANLGDDLHPLPSAHAFRNTIDEEIKNGIDGHNARDQRLARFQKELLAKYHVDTITALPINYEGEVMKYGEAYSSEVYNRHFARLQQTLQKQNAISAVSSLFNPYLAVRNLSMGLSATDLPTVVAFQRAAEKYRMDFVQKMNTDMALHSKMGEFNTYKGDKQLWESVPDFHFQPSPVSSLLVVYRLEIISLLLWTLGTAAFLYGLTGFSQFSR